MSVDDSEIKVAKYMNAKERAELEKVGLEWFMISHAVTMILSRICHRVEYFCTGQVICQVWSEAQNLRRGLRRKRAKRRLTRTMLWLEHSRV